MKGQEWYQEDDIAEEYEEKRFSKGGRLIDRREKQAVLDEIGPVEDRNVLEIACGTGRFTVMLAERGANVVGLDISGPMLQQGREKAKRVGVAENMNLMRGDAGRLPFPDDSFDSVLAMRFFHLADQPASFLSEIRRVSRDQVFFDTFNRFTTRSLYNWALPMGSRLYSRWEVSRLLDSAGLHLVKSDHDFALPYGLYREIPNKLASVFRDVDTTLISSPLGKRLASVSYWHARVP
ncbi:class I SAM-dependent methyltransferase [Halorientalis sp.]|uniref:class I SAM-dependent methyltransferase n=1 Tax=Halorientalis sp. TaxID=1931229 RepID=UPI002636FC0D|nr:class I SAM-dependent methyltransferase [Halorientalis sp.]